MRALVACECSGRVREALRRKGVEAFSIDLDPAEDNSPWHMQGDALMHLGNHASKYDLLIAHPPCTYLSNSGVRWLWKDIPGYSSWESFYPDDVETVKVEERWRQMEEGAKFFAAFLKQPISKIAVENPVMHGHARDAIDKALGHQMPPTHFVQPWWFGDKAFKATGFTLKGLPPLIKGSNCLVPPKKGTQEHKDWSVIHRMSPGKNRGKERSRTFPGIAEAIAEQWT